MKSLFGINVSGGNCEICGSTLNALNSCKVGKEFICKKCMSNVSHYYNKKNSSYEAMVKHINQRILDKKQIAMFSPNVSYGESEYFFIDVDNGKFVISPKADYKKENSDIFNVDDIISCEKRIDVKKRRGKV